MKILTEGMMYMFKFIRISTLVAISIMISACSSDKVFKEKLEKVLAENPEILFKTIEDNPTKFLMSVQKSSQKAQKEMQQKRQEEEKKQLEQAFDKPLKPKIDEDTIIRGPDDAPITLVEYSDFECPFCSRGYESVRDLMDKYQGKIKFIYKHLPLSFHQQALISAQYFEAIAIQSEKKAFKFHDKLFMNQSKLKKGEAYLKTVAKELGVDLKKLAKDIKSDKIKQKINEHMTEAKQFGMSGTPGFIINGIPVKGALPAEHFVGIINMLKEKGKLNL